MKNIIKLIVRSNEVGQRIDTYVASKKNEISRTRVKNLFANGCFPKSKNFLYI